MKITVFGAGAVGGHVAARLGAGAAAAGIEVAAVDAAPSSTRSGNAV